MYYVVGKHRIVVESEIPVQMSDYPDCEMIEGSPGVSMINFEVYEEGGKKKVKTKPQDNPLKLEVKLPDYECINGAYEIPAGTKGVQVDVVLSGEPFLPPIINVPEEDKKSRRIDISCNRGRLDKKQLFGSGSVSWTSVDETIEAVLMFVALNFPPIQESVRITLK